MKKRKKYIKMKLVVIMEMYEDEEVDELGQIIWNEVDEVWCWGERDYILLDFDKKDVKVVYEE